MANSIFGYYCTLGIAQFEWAATMADDAAQEKRCVIVDSMRAATKTNLRRTLVRHRWKHYDLLRSPQGRMSYSV